MDQAQLFEYLTGFPIRIFWSLLVFFLPVRKKERWYLYLPVPFLLLAALVGLGMVVFPLLGSLSPVTGPVYFALHYCLALAAYGIGIRLMCGVSLRETGYCLVCAYMAEHMVYCAGSISDYLLTFLGIMQGMDLEWLISLIVYVTVYFAFARRICRGGRYPFSALRSLSLMVLVMAVMFFLSIAVSDMGLSWLHGVYVLLLCTVLMAEEVRTAQQLYLQDEVREKERMEAIHAAQYEMSRENIELINRRSHDLRRQVAALKTLGTPAEQQEAIGEIERAVEIYDHTYQTGCRALDTVLMQEALKCRENHIELSVMADGKLLCFIRPVDLYTMLSNILDNAVEANQRIADEGRRSIHLSVHEKKGLVILQCENPYEGEIRMRDGLPETSKEDRANHGIGTKSISAAAAAWGGVMQIRAGEGMFVLRVVFQMPDAEADEKMKQ